VACRCAAAVLLAGAPLAAVERGPAVIVSEDEAVELAAAKARDGRVLVAWHTDAEGAEAITVQQLAPSGAALRRPLVLDVSAGALRLTDAADVAHGFVVGWNEVLAETVTTHLQLLRGAELRPAGRGSLAAVDAVMARAAPGRVAVVAEDSTTPDHLSLVVLGVDGRLVRGPGVLRRGGRTPAIAAAADGSFTVAWVERDGVFARRFAGDGSPRGRRFRVAGGADDGTAVRVAAARWGLVAIAWSVDRSLVVQLYDERGVPRGAARVVAQVDDAAPQFDLAVDGAGRSLVVWVAQDRLHGAFLDARGRLLESFPVNPFHPGAQLRPAAVAGAAGDLMALWVGDSDHEPGTRAVIVMRLAPDSPERP
jgi:hypothetical protein